MHLGNVGSKLPRPVDDFEFYAMKLHAMHGQLGGWMEGRKSLGFILDGIWIDASQHGVLGDWTALDRIEKIPERLWNFDGQIDRQDTYLQ